MNLSDHAYLSLATYRKSGAEVRTPVWFASADEQTHYCFSAAGAGKVKRIRNSSEAKLATCDGRGGSLGGWVPSRAFLVDDIEETAQAYDLLVKKYGWQMRLLNFFSRLSGKIHHRAVIRLEQ
jgi:PPOX class probable F420-dependent enzyme